MSTATVAGPRRMGAKAEGSLRWLVLAGVTIAAVMGVLDVTIVNVALPQMMGNLGCTPAEIGWVSTGYILSEVVILPMTAWLANRFGSKRYLCSSIVVFTLASVFCGLSTSLNHLVIWRIVQGLGGAALMSTAQAVIVRLFPEEEQALVQALFGLGLVMAPTCAPALGGWLCDNYSWAWIFYVNVPAGILSLLLVETGLANDNGEPGGIIDWGGIALLAIGLGSLQYVLEEGKRNDWFDSALIVRLTAAAAAGMLGLWAWELSRRNRAPVVDLRVMKNRNLAASLAISFAFGFAFYGVLFLFPLFAQTVLGFTATQTGLILMPAGLASGAAMISCGIVLKRKIDPRLIIAFGTVTFIAGMTMMQRLTGQSGSDECRYAMTLVGFGLGLIFIPLTVAAFSTLGEAQVGQASGQLGLMRQIGGSLGIAILSTYLDTMATYHRGHLVAHIYSANPVFQRYLAGAMQLLGKHGYAAVSARRAAMTIIDSAVQLQAGVLAFENCFVVVACSFVVAAPLLLLIRPQSR